jgi:ABC-type multidrug transport system fused ATPase/permease subunit
MKSDGSRSTSASDSLSFDESRNIGSSGAQAGDAAALASTRPSLRRLLGLARPEAKLLVVAVALMIFAEALTLYTPLLLANAYNILVEDPSTTADATSASDSRMSRINPIMIRVIIIQAIAVCASFLRSCIMGTAGERVVARLRNNLYAALLSQEIGFFDQHSSGELTSRLTSDATLMQQAASTALPEVVLGTTKLFVALGLMFWISPALAGVTLGLIATVLVLAMPVGKQLGALSKSYQDVLGTAQTYATEMLGAIRTVHSLAAERRECRRYRSVIGDPFDFPFWFPYKSQKTTYRVGFFKAICTSSLFAIGLGLGFGSLYLCLWYGFKMVSDGSISLGQLTAFQSYIFTLGASFGSTSAFLGQLIQAAGASGRIFYLLDRVPLIPGGQGRHDGDNPSHSQTTQSKQLRDGADVEAPLQRPLPSNPHVLVRPSSMQGAIQFSNVHFSYPSRPDVPVLSGFNLIVPANTTTALGKPSVSLVCLERNQKTYSSVLFGSSNAVGSSGVGKSTIVALLQRFYDVSKGSITIDAFDLREIDLHWLRSRIGFVQQEPTLFGLSCRENIAFGVNRVVSDQELEAVCRAANCDFVFRWPEGLDTLVGERGVKLSGGQKQRLAIARALLVDPRVLILDEATSALDSESEFLVQQAIRKAVKGRTVLVVAHRLSTIQEADQIVVVDNQRIVDVGKHDALLERCKRYQELIKRQQQPTFDDRPSKARNPSAQDADELDMIIKEAQTKIAKPVRVSLRPDR